MKGVETLVKLSKRRLDEQRRKVAELERFRDGLNVMLADLDHEVAAERSAAATDLILLNALPAFAAAAQQRRRNLVHSLMEAEAAIRVARDDLAENFQELKRYEIAVEMRDKRERDKEERKAQVRLDEIGLAQHRRRTTA